MSPGELYTEFEQLLEVNNLQAIKNKALALLNKDGLLLEDKVVATRTYKDLYSHDTINITVKLYTEHQLVIIFKVDFKDRITIYVEGLNDCKCECES